MQINFLFFYCCPYQEQYYLICCCQCCEVLSNSSLTEWHNVYFSFSYPSFSHFYFLLSTLDSFFLSFPFQIIQLFRTGSERTGNQRALVPKLKTQVSNTSDLFGVCGRGRQTSVYVLGPTAATQGRAADQKQIERSSNHFAVLCNC